MEVRPNKCWTCNVTNLWSFLSTFKSSLIHFVFEANFVKSVVWSNYKAYSKVIDCNHFLKLVTYRWVWSAHPGTVFEIYTPLHIFRKSCWNAWHVILYDQHLAFKILFRFKRFNLDVYRSWLARLICVSPTHLSWCFQCAILHLAVKQKTSSLQ